jgi:diacylglycerol kinase (ATP)
MRSKSELTAAIKCGGPAVLVVNVRARHGVRLADRARDELTAAGIAINKEFRVTDPALLDAALEEAVAHAPDLLIVAGGDGTLSAAGRLLAHRDIALGLLPLGTTNNLARSLGLPTRLPDAVAALATGHVVDVDLGGVGDGMFTNMVSVGVSVQVARHAPHRLKRQVGRAAYMLTALRALPGHRPFLARITADGKSMEFQTHQLNIANGAFHAGRKIARDASIDDRLLLAYRLGTANRAHLIAATIRHCATGWRRSMSDEHFLTTRALYLETDPALVLDVDGEVRGRTPTRVAIEPQALRVLAPADFIDT